MEKIMTALIRRKQVVFFIKKTGKMVNLKYPPEIKLTKLAEEIKSMLDLSMLVYIDGRWYGIEKRRKDESY